MSTTHEPLWTHCPTPSVASDPLDTVTGPTWDLVIVGAGIVGLCAALTAHESGRTVCVIDAGDVGLGVSGQATVKVTSGHGALAGELAERHGTDVAVAYQRANDHGYATLADLVSHLPEDVGWSPTEHVVHAHTPHGLALLARAVEVSELAGSPATETTVPPWATGRAWSWSRTALVQPVSLTRALAHRLKGLGARVLLNAPVRRVRATAELVTIELDSGEPLQARALLVATHTPIPDPDGHALRARSLRHCAIAVPVDRVPPGTTYGVDEGSMSTRPVVLPDGRPGAVVVGAKVRTGQIPDADPWAALARTAHAGFGGGLPVFAWATQDLSTPDLLPYVGRTRREPRVLVATGFGGWGFTNAAAVAASLPTILDSETQEEPSSAPADVPAQLPWQARRIWPHGGVSALLTDSAWVAGSLTADTLHAAGHQANPRLDPGQGQVVGGPLNPRAVSRTQDGVVHVVSARCTHLGCLVRWNRWEQSWDCPCHGSRFTPDGHVLHGPASQPLGLGTPTPEEA
jgi:glycine/D-amino acid oxidase-like deaminating enzyme/nitrite reductase/ring-hydroxylating ferredoxin subunit